MLVARIDVKTTNPLNGSQTVTKVGAMLRRKEHRKQKELARLATYAALNRKTFYVTMGADGRIPIVIRRVSPGTRPMDSDGLRASLKWIRDGVAEFFGADDSDKNFEWKYEQRRGRPGEYAVEIEIP